jgi:AcrR family transcriptional regulator
MRSLETRNSILDAASVLFEEQGYDKTTTHQIAARADVSVGALYRYFSDKEAILKEVYRREISLLRDRILEEFSAISITGKDVRSLIREALGRAFTIYEERPRLRQVLGEQSRKIPDLALLRETQEDELYQSVGRILTSVREVELPDVEVGAYLIALFCEHVIEDFLQYRREHSNLSNDRVLDAATDFIVSYIRIKRA